jgi:hypothetical protein
MRPLLVVAALLTLTLAGARTGTDAQAQAPSFSCFGAPADYTQAHDGVRGQPVDGVVTYPYKSVYLEYQNWLTDNTQADAVPGAHSEHIHLGACLPQAQVLTDANAKPWYMDTRIIFHNVENYTLTLNDAAIFSTNTSGGVGTVKGFKSTAAQLAELDAAMQASAGMGTKAVFQSHAIGTPGVDAQSNTPNGLKELRWHFEVRRSNPQALVDRWFMNGRAYFDYQYAGRVQQPDRTDGCLTFFVRTQGWIFWTTATGQAQNGYGYAGFGDSHMNREGPCKIPAAWTPDALAAPKPDSWQTIVRTTDGTGPTYVYVDPNMHVHPETNAWSKYLGDPRQTGTLVDGGYNNTVTVPLGTLGLSGGVHRFMVQGHKLPPVGVQPFNTMITVMPIQVGDSC